MPISVPFKWDELKNELTAKLFWKRHAFSQIFKSSKATETTIKMLKSRMVGWWQNGHDGILMDTDISPLENGIAMDIVGIFPREALLKIQEDCSGFWFNKTSIDKGKITKAMILSSPEDRAIPEYDNPTPLDIIARVGIELEGGWATKIPSRLIHQDGSVFSNGIPRISRDGLTRRVMGIMHGEIQFGPYASDKIPWESRTDRAPNGDERGSEIFFDDRTASPFWLSFRELYPEFLDDTCGMHVHVSFPNPMIYSVFVDKRFQPWLINGLREWGRKNDIQQASFWKRLMGENHFCKMMYEPTSQLIAQTRTPARYAAVNYCYTKHRTMEIRVLPMFMQVDESISAIKEVLRLIQIWGNAKTPVLVNPNTTMYLDAKPEE